MKKTTVFAAVTLITSLFFSLSAFSVCTTTGCSGVGKEVLLSVYPNSSGHIYLQAGAGKENLDCDLHEGHYTVLKSNHSAFEAAYSTILTALTTQKHLIVRIIDKSPICEVSYVRMFM